MKTGLVLEGGALRAIFSSGVCDGLLEGGIMTDYFIGVSAGAAYGVSYLSRQPRRNLEVVTRFAPDRRYMGMRNLAVRITRVISVWSFPIRLSQTSWSPLTTTPFRPIPERRRRWSLI